MLYARFAILALRLGGQTTKIWAALAREAVLADPVGLAAQTLVKMRISFAFSEDTRNLILNCRSACS